MLTTKIVLTLHSVEYHHHFTSLETKYSIYSVLMNPKCLKHTRLMLPLLYLER